MAKVLVIDDEPLVRENIAAYLEDEGHTVMTTTTAESGLSRLGKFEPDLVVVDLRLQGANGEAFVRTAYKLNPQTQFIIHTGSQEYRLPPTLKELGLAQQQILYKPVGDLGHLSTLIRELLGAEITAPHASTDGRVISKGC